MPTFVTLAKWTDEGIRNIKDSPKRRQAFEDRITLMGGKVKDAYLVMGEYDLVLVTEVPNDETAAKMAAAVSSSLGGPFLMNETAANEMPPGPTCSGWSMGLST